MENSMQLKAKIKNLAKDKNIPAQPVLQNFVMQRFLERLSVSNYKEVSVLKGGLLISSILGIDQRITMDY